MNDETLRRALDKLDAAKGFDAPVTEILDAEEIDEMRGGLVTLLGGPPTPDDTDTACSCPEDCDYRKGGHCLLAPDYRASCSWKEPGAMAPRVPPLSDIASEAVGRYERGR